MGAGSGGGYSSSPSSGEAFLENIANLSRRYPLNPQGRFGEQGRSPGVQVVKSTDPLGTAQDFFEKLGGGGRIKPLPGGKGWRSEFDDGSEVVYRPTSKSKSPAVDIQMSGQFGDRYKIHFEHL